MAPSTDWLPSSVGHPAGSDARRPASPVRMRCPCSSARCSSALHCSSYGPGETAMTHGFPWVTARGLIPLLGVVGVLTLPRDREEDAKRIALGASLVTTIGSIVMAAQFKTNGPRFQFTQDYDWIKAFGAHYAVGVDGIALALILMTTILTPVCILASWHDADRPQVERADGETETVIEPRGGRGPKLFFSLLLATETPVV